VAIDHDGTFDDWRFHGAPFELKAVLVRSYRDSVPGQKKGPGDGKIGLRQ
jgi:hypothetical protein